MPPKIIETVAKEVISLAKGEFQITKETHPELMAVYENLVAKNGIKNPPPVLVSDALSAGNPMDYNKENGVIRIAHEWAQNPAHESVEVGFAHELGHHLGMHKPISLLMPLKDQVKIAHGHEKEADRFAVSLTGDKVAVGKVRKHLLSDEFVHGGADKQQGFFAGIIEKINRRLGVNAIYGTPKQAAQNIKLADHPANDRFVQRLIAEKNAGYNTRTNGFAESIDRSMDMQTPAILEQSKLGMKSTLNGFTDRIAEETKKARAFKESLEQLTGGRKV